MSEKVLPNIFEIGGSVVYQGKTYRFPGTVSGITDDGQIVVSAIGSPNGDYKNMKHIFGPSQLAKADPPQPDSVDMEPVAWGYEEAGYYDEKAGKPKGWYKAVSLGEITPFHSVRHISPLYSQAQLDQAVKDALIKSDQTNYKAGQRIADGAMIEIAEAANAARKKALEEAALEVITYRAQMAYQGDVPKFRAAVELNKRIKSLSDQEA